MPVFSFSPIGPDTRYWAFLKSIDFALSRLLQGENAAQLTELDRDRLSALADFLRAIEQVSSDTGDLAAAQKMLVASDSARPNFTYSRDLKAKIARNTSFMEYSASSKLSFKEKLERLEDAARKLSRGTGQLFSTQVPKTEINVLRSVVRSLLDDVEVIKGR